MHKFGVGGSSRWRFLTFRLLSGVVITSVLVAASAAAQSADGTAASASDQPSAPTGWLAWNDHFFEPCQGDCAISLYGGREVTTSMERIFLLKYPARPFWTWHWGNSGIIAGAFSRRAATLWDSVNIEPEFGWGSASVKCMQPNSGEPSTLGGRIFHGTHT